MAAHGPVNTFKLSLYFQKEDLKLLRTIPSETLFEKIRALEKFCGEKMVKSILACVETIYSYPFQRGGKEGPTFTLSVAGAVALEVHTGEFIKGKDHAKKALQLLKTIDNRINELTIWTGGGCASANEIISY